MKIWTAEEIREKLVQGDKQFLTRGLMAIYENQTADEKISMTTVHDNGIGFSGFDAQILTSFAEQWRSKGYLSQKQFNILMKRMPKYAGQLERIAALKRMEKTAEPTVYAEANECPVTNGFILFPNGTLVHTADMVEHYDNEGEITEWVGHVDGVKYILVND